MATVLICVILVILCALGVKSYVGKIAHGCCGGGSDAVKRQKPSDGDVSHYPHTYEIGIEGMSCQNCAARIENAFNTAESGNYYAAVKLGKKLAVVHAKQTVPPEELRRIVVQAGYDVTEIKGE